MKTVLLREDNHDMIKCTVPDILKKTGVNATRFNSAL